MRTFTKCVEILDSNILGVDKTQFRILQAELVSPPAGLAGVSRGLQPCLFGEAYDNEIG